MRVAVSWRADVGTVLTLTTRISTSSVQTQTLTVTYCFESGGLVVSGRLGAIAGVS